MDEEIKHITKRLNSTGSTSEETGMPMEAHQQECQHKTQLCTSNSTTDSFPSLPLTHTNPDQVWKSMFL